MEMLSIQAFQVSLRQVALQRGARVPFSRPSPLSHCAARQQQHSSSNIHSTLTMSAGMPDTSWLMAAQDPMHRKLVFRPAAPLSEHVKACIAFLTRVSRFEINGGTKKELEITVFLDPSADDPESLVVSYTITRTAKDFEMIQRAVHDHSRHHPDLKKYAVPSCALCDQFKDMTPVSSSVFKSTESVRASAEERLTFMVKGALVPPSSPELHCEGLLCIPSGLTRFLLRDVDQTKIGLC